MNKVEYGEQLTLENGKDYVCYGRVSEENKSYLWLINTNNKDDKIIVEEIVDKDLSLRIIKDDNLKKHLDTVFKNKYTK